MAEPFLGEIRMMGFAHAPQGWAMANGQFMPINQNQALFSLLGTTFGGNGQTTFQLPSLQGRVPLHEGAGFNLGQQGGATAHTVTQSELPAHVHFGMASSANATSAVPTAGSSVLATSVNYEAYRSASSLTTLHPGTITPTGGSQPHQNMQPYLVINFCIALIGIFPSPN